MGGLPSKEYRMFLELSQNDQPDNLLPFNESHKYSVNRTDLYIIPLSLESCNNFGLKFRNVKKRGSSLNGSCLELKVRTQYSDGIEEWNKVLSMSIHTIRLLEATDTKSNCSDTNVEYFISFSNDLMKINLEEILKLIIANLKFSKNFVGKSELIQSLHIPLGFAIVNKRISVDKSYEDTLLTMDLFKLIGEESSKQKSTIEPTTRILRSISIEGNITNTNLEEIMEISSMTTSYNKFVCGYPEAIKYYLDQTK